MSEEEIKIEKKETGGKSLYEYQKADLDKIFARINECGPEYNILYQLPTGGGKTVVFSEIAKRYIAQTGKKVVILTHRIELSAQTSRMLTEFGVSNKVIDSKVKELYDHEHFMCFVAMVETLNNRLQDEKVTLDGIGLVIIDEAHYNSFRKLFQYFDNAHILGVTATPLSSNMNLPMKDNYSELIVGHSIEYLVENGYLAKATTYSYEVGLGTLKVGINGDYTVSSSELLYSNQEMQGKLLRAYNERARGKKILIFNNGIKTSQQVYRTFAAAGLNVRHLDSKNTKDERKDIIEWFKTTPNAILSSVGILTTGFDEPSVEVIIMNRATRSLTLYFQMIGRGSRIFKNKKSFEIIDLGNNAARFGLWDQPIDWQRVFRSPQYYLDNLVPDEEIERQFKYRWPEALKRRFPNTTEFGFDVYAVNDAVLAEGLRPSVVLERSVDQHVEMCVANGEDIMDAWSLAKMLDEDIADRIRRYCYCICNSTRNYRSWLQDEYNKKLRKRIRERFPST